MFRCVPASLSLRAPTEKVASSVRVSDAPGVQDAGGDVVPDEVRRVERQIERQFRRYRGGIRRGIGFDPEVLTAGVQGRVGPFFNEGVYFRPSAKFGFGEVTTMVAFNFEAIYRLPFTPRSARSSAYLGAGPSFNFRNRNFDEARQGGRDLYFSDFNYNTGLNFVTGLQFRNGGFVEMRDMAWGKPAVRIFCRLRILTTIVFSPGGRRFGCSACMVNRRRWPNR